MSTLDRPGSGEVEPGVGGGGAAPGPDKAASAVLWTTTQPLRDCPIWGVTEWRPLPPCPTRITVEFAKASALEILPDVGASEGLV